MIFDSNKLFDNREYLLSLFRTIKNAPRLDKDSWKYKQFSNWITSARREVKINTKQDLMKYVRRAGDICIGSMWYSNKENIKDYWIDSVKKAIKSGQSDDLKEKSIYIYRNNKYYHKDHSFEVGDEIYNKSEYFLHNGQALSKKEYITAFYEYEDLDQCYLKKITDKTFPKKYGDYNIAVEFYTRKFNKETLFQYLLASGKRKNESDYRLDLTWDEAKDIKFVADKELVDAIKKAKEAGDRMEFRFSFKGARKKSHKFLKELVGQRYYNLEEIPKVLETIRETLAL